ncbi:DNA-binding domain-containing protein [Neisseria yangbaofengii]|uniref:HvfC family RiPP maturation protein n=1 Tax=Neisseria yangbaofengii TaxID=2709396 RepID=UPI0013ECCBE7|nr:putative DNA-binding domain-containing protein [Neisseria yangbaofengii]
MSETSAEYQHRFAAAIRAGGNAQDFDSCRLAVYVRLVYNNIHGFIDRCYTETPQYCAAESWQAAKMQFIREGQAQSPYFQEIAGEFLQYCRQHNLFSDGLLALMDFEHTQLLAETAIIKAMRPYDADAVYTLSEAAFLRHYDYAVHHDLSENQTAMLVWRNPQDVVWYREADDFTALLLQALSDNPMNLAGLQAMLAEWMPSENPHWAEELASRWQTWHAEGILAERQP